MYVLECFRVVPQRFVPIKFFLVTEIVLSDTSAFLVNSGTVILSLENMKDNIIFCISGSSFLSSFFSSLTERQPETIRIARYINQEICPPTPYVDRVFLITSQLSFLRRKPSFAGEIDDISEFLR